MKNFAAAARLGVLVLFTTGLLDRLQEGRCAAVQPRPGHLRRHPVRRDQLADLRRHHRLHHRRQRAELREGARHYLLRRRSRSQATPRCSAMACALLRAESLITTGVYTSSRRRRWPRRYSRPPPARTSATQSVSITTRHRRCHDSLHQRRQHRRPAPAALRMRARSKSRNHITLNAIGCATDKIDSAVATAAYVITPPAAAPVFDPAPGAYTSEQHVTLTSATPGATFRYTTDGSDPTCTTGTSYGGPIAIANSLTLKAVACASGYLRQPRHQRRLRHHAAAAAVRLAQHRHRQSRGESADLRRRLDRRPTRTATPSTSRAAASSRAARRCSASSTPASPATSCSPRASMASTSRASRAARRASACCSTPDFTQTGDESHLRRHDGRRRRHASRAPTASPSATPRPATSPPPAPARATSSSRAPATRTRRPSRSTAASRRHGIRPARCARSRPACRRRCTSASRSARATTPTSARRRRSATCTSVDPTGNVIIGPNEFTGDIGAGTPGGGGGGGPTPPPTGPVASGRPVARRDAGGAGAAVGQRRQLQHRGLRRGRRHRRRQHPRQRRALSQGDDGHRAGGRAARRACLERQSGEGHRDHERPQHGLERGRHAAAGRRHCCARTSRRRSIRR